MVVKGAERCLGFSERKMNKRPLHPSRGALAHWYGILCLVTLVAGKLMDAGASLLDLLHRASQLAEDCFARLLPNVDVTPRQVAVLAAIDKNDGVSQTYICNITGVDRSTLADIVRRLVVRKLVRRKRSKLDARAYELHVTEEGRRTLQRVTPILTSVEHELLSTLQMEDRTRLIDLLLALTADGK